MINLHLEAPLKVTQTKHGRLVMLPPVREATDEDKSNLHKLVARLLLEDYRMPLKQDK